MPAIGWTLLVGDDEEHRILIRSALEQTAPSVSVIEVEDGVEALAWLRRRIVDEESIREGLVILDLGLPRVSGFEVLEWIRSAPGLKTVPVVVLTASENALDAEHAFNLGATAYFQKPADFRRYIDLLGRVFQLVGSRSEDTAST